MVDPIKNTTETAGDCESAINPDDIPLFQSQAFLGRVYLTLTLQLLLTITTLFVSVPLITSSGTNFTVDIISAVVLFIGIGLLYQYQKECPANYVLLCLCTLCVSYQVSLSCAYFFPAGSQMSRLKIFIESWCLTSIVLVSLSCHAVKAAARKRRDYRFLELYLLKAALVLMLLLLFLLVLYPGRRLILCHLIMAGFGSFVYSLYIVYFTHSLVVVTQLPYQHHIWASLSLYIYGIALFLFIFLLIAAN
ncbi:Protein LIFEGUARD 2 [Linum grandiflorum]